ncbi:MAG: FMN-binding protein [Patescibacteria group bacterium]|jgi:uncharacterized protein with FMN-binding domain|nr:FMN-binding protein [Patescibacteria group bacterium]
MKKLILAAFVVATFIIYSVHQHQDGSAAVVAPARTSTTPTPASSPAPGSTPAAAIAYKDGRYTGDAADAVYGNIQVAATIQNGKITDVEFLQYPNDRNTSVRINTQAMPYLKQEAISVQSGHVDIVSGATDSSQAFIQSLSSALAKAQS